MTEDTQIVPVDEYGPVEDDEAEREWLLAHVAELSAAQQKYIGAYDGQNTAEAAKEAGVTSAAVRNWRMRSTLFKGVERLVSEGAKGLSSSLAKAKLERATNSAADRLITGALMPLEADAGYKQREVQLKYINSLLDRGEVIKPRAPAVVVNNNTVSIDQRAIELWQNGGSAAWRDAVRGSTEPPIDAAYDSPENDRLDFEDVIVARERAGRQTTRRERLFTESEERTNDD